MKATVTYYLNNQLEPRARITVTRELLESPELARHVIGKLEAGPNFSRYEGWFGGYAAVRVEIIHIPALLNEVTKAYLEAKKALASLHKRQVFKIR